jgi:CTD nuclear envelope phosphatase 1
MNSLNILSTIAPTPPSSPPRSRSGSASDLTKENTRAGHLKQEQTSEAQDLSLKAASESSVGGEDYATTAEAASPSMDVNEQTPLLGETRPDHFGDVKGSAGWRALPKRLSSAFIGTIRVVIATVAAPFRYIVAWFYDEDGQFSPLFPLITVYRVLKPRKKKKSLPPMSDSEKSKSTRQARDRNGSKPRPQKRTTRPPSVASSTTAIATDSEFDENSGLRKSDDQRSTRTRSSMSTSGDEISPTRRSIRIKLHNDEMIKRRKQPESNPPQPSKEDAKEVVAALLKSPSSPGNSKLTKFPRTPAPPRPLIPRRNPSYSNVSSHGPHQKTLVIDLDETLIHSHSKGGRFAQGHMVEVKMQHAVGVGGTILGPQIPILYYVHKRPHCDEFLRKVCLYRTKPDSKR